jgi:predicted RNase H-like HicB family nuclease
VHNEFTAIVEKDGPWYITYCAEVPGANGQGKSREECLANLREAISLISGTSGVMVASYEEKEKSMLCRRTHRRVTRKPTLATPR